jgi:hypothetical protein
MVGFLRPSFFLQLLSKTDDDAMKQAIDDIINQRFKLVLKQ